MENKEINQVWENLKERALQEENVVVVEDDDKGLIRWKDGFFVKCRAGDLR